MKMLLVASWGAAFVGLSLATTTAQAQTRNFFGPDAGWYWRIDGGATIPQDNHIREFGPFSSGQKIDYDVGAGVNGGVGYMFNPYIAAEVEIGGTWNSVHSIEGASVHDTGFGTAPFLANLVLQYPIPQTRLVPYLGGGVGGAATFFDTDHFVEPVPGGAVSLHGWEDDFVFAWQGLAGLRLKLNDAFSVGLSYRYLHVDSSTFHYDSHHYADPSIDLGLSSQDSHMVGLTFLMRF